MRKLFSLVILLFFTTAAMAQTAYIQVTGESGLTVYLNGEYKGTTSAEFNGLVIENVRQGSHTIKIVKTGYSPYEETISVKSGEVFAYKVKPFQKQEVTVTEKGNGTISEKVKKGATGTLLVQSVPIEIKITMPKVEGIENLQKTKDQWTVDKLLEGTYDIKFIFNNKTISKTFEITGNDVTSIFVNMLNGDVKISSSRDERIKKEEALKNANEKREALIKKLCETYYFKPGLTVSEFMNYNTRFSKEIGYNYIDYNTNDFKVYGRRSGKTPVEGPNQITCTTDGRNNVYAYEFFAAASEKNDDPSVYAFYKELIKKIKEELPSTFYTESDHYLTLYSRNSNGLRVSITYSNWELGGRNSKGSFVNIDFRVDD
ncbi:MAG TPA: PEGA domain-containing protein [Phnomibacter sp.]|nr:PEGA domain-containing protein [Phnomibacter sp.]